MIRTIEQDYEEQDHNEEYTPKVREHGSREAAEQYLKTQGYTWDEEDEEWSIPGQSWMVAHIQE